MLYKLVKKFLYPGFVFSTLQFIAELIDEYNDFRVLLVDLIDSSAKCSIPFHKCHQVLLDQDDIGGRLTKGGNTHAKDLSASPKGRVHYVSRGERAAKSQARVSGRSAPRPALCGNRDGPSSRLRVHDHAVSRVMADHWPAPAQL